MLLADDCENSTDPNVRERCRCRDPDDNDDKDLRPRCGFVWWPLAVGVAIGAAPASDKLPANDDPDHGHREQQ